MAEINVGNPVSGINFVGRENELAHLVELLQLGQNVVLIAPRRYGKTSLVFEALRLMSEKGAYTSFSDVFATPNLNALSAQITESVLKNHRLDGIFTKTRNSAVSMIQNLKMKAAIEDFEFIIGFAGSKTDDWELLGNSIDFVDKFAVKHQKKMVCAFDEFGDITKLDGKQIVKLFRSKLQLHQNTSYIFSGSYESVMSGLFLEKNSPFFRFARIITLGKIEVEAFRKFYKLQLNKYALQLSDELIDRVLDFTGGHPYYSQLALQEMIVFNALQKRTPDFEEIMQGMLRSEKNYLEKSWEEISAKKEAVNTVLAVCKGGDKIYAELKDSGINISRALRNLVLNGTLLRHDKGYEMSDPLLDYWIKKNVITKLN